MILDAFLDALKDTAIAIPFLFAAYLLMEALEKHSEILTSKLFTKKKYFGPLFGSAMGLIPQCGFSAAMSNLYVGGVIELGTLISVFLATSDEAVLIMISHPSALPKIWVLLLTKFIIGIIFGYLINLIFCRKPNNRHVEDICKDEHCGCEEEKGILKPAIIHTLKILGWIFGICFALNIIVSLIGTDKLAVMLGGNIFLQPLITALLGLIPNCALSVLFTELYIAGGLSFASTIAGLCSGAGLGLIVLFRMNSNKKDCFKVVGTLYACAAISGMILQLLPL
ncbi:MAG: arsenic efflux protein [Parasporobacterium sp.]|nr:arsenic efflux protein [Parasporobacterium sp.]